ncbi:MAG: hypothetical protein ACLGIR_04595 [Actinomycetes bacterium]
MTTSTSRPRWRTTTAGAVAAVLLLAGCGGGTAGEPVETETFDVSTLDLPDFITEIPEGVDPALLAPMTGLGPCEFDIPANVDPDDVEGLVLPPGAVVAEASDAGPLVNVQGYLPYTPVQVRVFYETSEVLEQLQIEDEIREAEVLVGDGTHRLFLKAQAVCELGSVFVGVVAPEIAAEDLPAPAGTLSPQPLP